MPSTPGGATNTIDLSVIANVPALASAETAASEAFWANCGCQYAGVNAATFPSLAGMSTSTASVIAIFLSVGLVHCRACCSHDDESAAHDAAERPAIPTVAATWGTTNAGSKPAAHAANAAQQSAAAPS